MRWRNAPGCLLLPIYVSLICGRWVLDHVLEYVAQAVVWCFGENVLNGNLFPTQAQWLKAWPADKTLNPFNGREHEQQDPPS